MIVGLTGYYCSGKTTVKKYLMEKCGFDEIDVDKVGHLVLESDVSKIAEAFGDEIIVNGKVDRKRLGRIVFNDRSKLQKLNSIMHPIMKGIIEEEIQANQSKDYIIDAALLFEMNLDKLCDSIVVVKSNFILKIFRGLRRDNSNICKIIRIIFSQNVMKFAKSQAKNVDIYYINNNGSLEKLKIKLDIIIGVLCGIR